MIVYGGRPGLRNTPASAEVWQFDTTTSGWSFVGQGPGPRFDHTSALLDGILYVFGGFSGTAVLGDMWKCDIATTTWSQILDVPVPPRYGHMSAAVNGHVYILGGSDLTGDLSDAWSYNVELGM